ncbi:TPA: hypothetical protein I3319_004930, partial [Enterobacter hormaechei subsp. xiangfangensis]|nr:hypothetical protein [Enterobacter hormaechei subsp. xiangfangensis]
KIIKPSQLDDKRSLKKNKIISAEHRLVTKPIIVALTKPSIPNSVLFFNITVPTPTPPIIDMITAIEYTEEKSAKVCVVTTCDTIKNNTTLFTPGKTVKSSDQNLSLTIIEKIKFILFIFL